MMARGLGYLLTIAAVLVVVVTGSAVTESEQKDTFTGATVMGVISGRNGSPLSRPVKVVMNGGAYTTYSQANGSFIFLNVAAGTYRLEVLSKSEIYHAHLVHVSAKTGKVKVQESLTRRNVGHPVQIDPIAKADYFEKREEYSIMSIFQNPMTLMVGFTLFMVVVMPKLTDSEAFKEMQKEVQEAQQQQGSGSVQQAAQ
eukprot:GFYU01005413.1.p1 GENE.GFYU01005413.1~~GFYU01005413.1.p1  ORF type:complete len:199 (-),score=39.78 GFYU01005413.1:267-863(-)